jgi:YaiO family outer membrane protein
MEFYPRFRPGTYTFVNVGASPDATLYPEYRVAFDLYQFIGRGFEMSGGARYMDFGTVTSIYVGTVSKYVGNWMLTGKVYRVPADNDLDSTSWHGGFRRYFGGDGTSYVGVTYSHGLSREEVRNLSDLAALDADTIRGEFDCLFGSRVRLSGGAGTSRQDRVDRAPLWQTTISGGLSVEF